MKVRMGFVSNSSSSSFTALMTRDRFESMDLTSGERAFLNVIDVGFPVLEGVTMFTFSTMSGNHDDSEWVNIKDFADSLVKYAQQSNDPMYEEYKEELDRILKKPKPKKSNRYYGGSYSDFSYDTWEFFFEMFHEARSSFEQKCSELQKESFCITTSVDF